MNENPETGERYIIRLENRLPSYSHGFRDGEEVIAIRQDSSDKYAWRFKNGKNEWWVHLRDVEKIDPGPTEEEVMAIFGIVPQPHCTTCTCH